MGYILDRKIFDRALALEAAESGAEIFVKTSAISLLKIERGNASRNSQKNYEDIWRGTIGKEIARDYRVKAFFTDLSDSDLNSIMHSLEDMNTSMANFSS